MSGGRVDIEIDSKFSKRLKYDYALFDLIGVRTGYLSMTRQLFKTGGQGIKIRMFCYFFPPTLMFSITYCQTEIKT